MGRYAEFLCVSDEELYTRRRQILNELGLSLEELRERAENYTLAGDEYQAWEDLRSIAFLLEEKLTDD